MRSTRAHNTVEIGGKEQSEIWSVFRMARQARVEGATAEASGDRYTFRGAYRPYFDHSLLHEREFIYRVGELSVIDRVRGAAPRPLLSFVHLHPDFSAELVDASVVAYGHGLRVSLLPTGCAQVRLIFGESVPIQGWYCPEFGVAQPNAVVEMSAANVGEPFGYRITVTTCEVTIAP